MIFNDRHLRRVLSAYMDYSKGPALIFRLIRIALTPARFSIAGSEESSPSRKSGACIIATNVWPPDSSLNPLTYRCAGTGTPSENLPIGGHYRSRSKVKRLYSDRSSFQRINSIAILAAAQILVQMGFW